MTQSLASDVCGTLINPLAMSAPLGKAAGDKAGAVATLWRETQLTYSFRRAAMGCYVPFSQVTAEALEHALDVLGIEVNAEDAAVLLARYQRLPAFDEVPDALATLAGQAYGMHAFSNGTLGDIQALTDNAGLSVYLGAPVSVEDVRTFKPDPRVYALFGNKTGSDPGDTWLVSSTPFDIIGAGEAGWNTIWVQRNPDLPFDTWGKRPAHVVSDLGEITSLIG